MKHLIFISISVILCSIVILSCGESKEEKEKREAELKLAAVLDSIENARTTLAMQEEGKVIADLNFFISKKDYEQNKGKYLKGIKDERLSGYLIGNYKAMISPKTYFDNDALYYVEFRGQPYGYERYDGDLKQQYKEIFDLYKSKYGDPTYERYSFPASYETSEGYYYELARWDLGKRTISIRLTPWAGMYGINLAIFRNDIEDRIQDGQERERAERNKSAKSVI